MESSGEVFCVGVGWCWRIIAEVAVQVFDVRVLLQDEWLCEGLSMRYIVGRAV